MSQKNLRIAKGFHPFTLFQNVRELLSTVFAEVTISSAVEARKRNIRTVAHSSVGSPNPNNYRVSKKLYLFLLFYDF